MIRRGVSAFLFTVAVSAALPTMLAAQRFSVAAGPSFPIGEFSDEAVRGYHVQGSVAFRVPVVPFDLRTDLVYLSFSNVEREPGINVTLGGEWFRQLGLVLNGQYGLSLGSVEPYALLGVGLVREWHGDRSYSGTDHIAVSLNAGIGMEVPLNQRFGLFVEARQLNIAGGGTLSLAPPAVSPEVAFKSVPIAFGIRF